MVSDQGGQILQVFFIGMFYHVVIIQGAVTIQGAVF